VSNPISGTNKKIDKARKEKQKVDWARTQRLDGVVLNDDQTDIVSIARITIKNWTAKMLPAFLRENNIFVPEKKKTWSDCIWFLLNHMKGESF